MNIKRFLTIASGVFIISATGAKAYTIADNNPADVYINFFNPSYHGQFNLTDYGFQPGLQHVTSAMVTFKLWDLPVFGGSEGYNIVIEGTSLFSDGSFSGFIDRTSPVDNSTTVLATLLGNLDADGILNYTISRTSGEFWLVNANLSAEVADSPKVPDNGSSSFLLGLSLLGILGIRRGLVTGSVA